MNQNNPEDLIQIENLIAFCKRQYKPGTVIQNVEQDHHHYAIAYDSVIFTPCFNGVGNFRGLYGMDGFGWLVKYHPDGSLKFSKIVNNLMMANSSSEYTYDIPFYSFGDQSQNVKLQDYNYLIKILKTKNII